MIVYHAGGGDGDHGVGDDPAAGLQPAEATRPGRR